MVYWSMTEDAIINDREKRVSLINSVHKIGQLHANEWKCTTFSYFIEK